MNDFKKIKNYLKCLFGKHDYDISDYLVDFINRPDKEGNLTNGNYLLLYMTRPYVNCKRCNRNVRWKP